MKKRSSNLEYQIRVDDVMSQMLKGSTNTGVLLGFIRGKYKVSDNQGEIYIRKAREQIGSIMPDWERMEQIGLSLARYNLLIKENFDKEDYKEVRQTQNQIDILLGLRAPTQSEDVTPATGEIIIKIEGGNPPRTNEDDLPEYED